VEPDRKASFSKEFVGLFEAQFSRLARYLNRLTGDRDLASDLAQEAFLRLYQRGSMPDQPEAWLVSVAMNLLRTFASTRTRRLKLLTDTRAEATLSDPPRAPDEGMEGIEERQRVRTALERMPERERRMLLLQVEGYTYRDIATAIRIHEASVGTLLVRARQTFRRHYEELFGAS
jgi:RNA polymerase sigma factor (sigma-70 family)